MLRRSDGRPDLLEAVLPRLTETARGRGAHRLLLLMLLAGAALAARGPVMRYLARSHLESGATWLSVQHVDDALEDFSTAASLDPRLAEAWYGQGECLLKLRKLPQAAQALRRAVAENAAGPDALYLLGRTETDLGRFAEAADALQRFVKLKPRDAEGWKRLAFARYRAGSYDEARQAISRSLELDPSEAGGYFLRAEIGATQGADPRLVEADARRGLSLQPAYARGYVSLAQAAVREKQPAAAVRAASAGLRYAQIPDDRRALLYLRAQAEQQLGSYSDAARDLASSSRIQEAAARPAP